MFDSIDPTLPQAVRERLQSLNDDDSSIHDRVEAINAGVSAKERKQLLTEAIRSTTNAERMFWLRREADRLNQAANPVSACSKGCSHCCHVGVMVMDTEALAIGREIGRVPSEPPPGKFATTDPDQDPTEHEQLSSTLMTEFRGQRCPFLGAQSECTIYDSRPIACRLQINLDGDDLLCRLVPGGRVPVPYLDVTASRIAYIATWGTHRKMADLRYFFPAEAVAPKLGR